MKRRKDSPGQPRGTIREILDDLRQLQFPAEFRIERPASELLYPARPASADLPAASATEQSPTPPHLLKLAQAAVECVNCLWYLKTKHFKRQWEDPEISDDDPRVRRALGRLNKGIEVLRESGIEVQDPTNKRYPPGGEGMMRPIQLVPTDGLTFEMVSETVTPIIYQNDRLIQRGEVFVAVPKEPPSPNPAIASDVFPTTCGNAPDEPSDRERTPEWQLSSSTGNESSTRIGSDLPAGAVSTESGGTAESGRTAETPESAGKDCLRDEAQDPT